MVKGNKLENVITDFTNSKDYMASTVISRARKGRALASGAVPLATQNWSSKVRTYDVQKGIIKIQANIEEAFLARNRMFEASDFGGTESSFVYEEVLEDLFSPKVRTKLIKTVASIAPRDGLVAFYLDWDFKSTDLEKRVGPIDRDHYLQSEIVADEVIDTGNNQVELIMKNKVIISNSPVFKYMKIENCFLDPEALTVEDSRFIGFRFQESLNDLVAKGQLTEAQARRWVSIETIDDENNLSIFQAENEYEKRRNIIRMWRREFEDGRFLIREYIWLDEADKEIVELPYSSTHLPAMIVQFDFNPEGFNGGTVGERLGDNQTIATALQRGIIDSLAIANNGQVFYNPKDGTPETISAIKARKRYIPMKNPTGIQFGSFQPLPPSVTAFQQGIHMENDLLIGTSSQGPGLSKAGTNGTGEVQLSTGQMMLKMFMRNISLSLQEVAPWVIGKARELLTIDDLIEKYKVTQAEAELFLINGKNIDLKVGTVIDQDRMMRNIMLLLQQSKAMERSLDPSVIKNLTAEFFRAMDRNRYAKTTMESTVAEQMAQGEGQMAQEMHQAELAKLNSEVELNQAIARGRTSDSIAKAQKIKAEAGLASAKQMESMANAQGRVAENILKPIKDRVELEQLINQNTGE